MDHYHVIELVGEGSFGKVYKARRKKSAQIVAIKFIVKHGKTEKDIHNLRQEIEILRSLEHPNIIQVCAKGSKTPTHSTSSIVSSSTKASMSTWALLLVQELILNPFVFSV